MNVYLKKLVKAPGRLNLFYSTYREFWFNALADMKQFERGLKPHLPAPAESARHREIIGRIINAYCLAKEAQKKVPPAYQVNAEWEPLVNSWLSPYMKALQARDAAAVSDFLSNLFRNPGTYGLVSLSRYDDMAKGDGFRRKEFVNAVLEDFADWQDLTGRQDARELATPIVGNPWGYYVGDTLLLPDASRHSFTAHKINALFRGISNPVAAEIGGGYGGMAYFLLKMRADARYVNFDLPEILSIHQYYLMNALPEKKFLLYGEREMGGIDSETIRSVDACLMPNFMLPTLASGAVDLFVNTVSLSEMDAATVKEYVAQMARTSRKYLYHVNSDRPIATGGGHVEVCASSFPIPEDHMKLIHKGYSLWSKGQKRYKEFLYETVAG